MLLGRKQKQVLERLEGLRLPSSNLGLTRCMTPEFVRTLRLGGQRRCLHGSTRSELKTSVLIAGGIAAYATMIAREKNGTACSFDLNTVSPSRVSGVHVHITDAPYLTIIPRHLQIRNTQHHASTPSHQSKQPPRLLSHCNLGILCV